MTRAALACAVVATLTACGPAYYCDGTETYCVDGVPFHFTDLPDTYSGSPLIQARLEAQLGVSLRYWGVARAELNGWRVIYQLDLVACRSTTQLAAGCWDEDDRTITLTFYGEEFALGCIEDASLPHEIGHFVEDGHDEPRWCDYAAPWAELLAQPECAALAAAHDYNSPLYLWYGGACRSTWINP